MRHLPRLVAETAVGKTVPVTVWRKRQERDAAGRRSASSTRPNRSPLAATPEGQAVETGNARP